MQAEDFVKKKEASEIDQRRIDSAAKSRFERRFDVACKARSAQDITEGPIEAARIVVCSLGVPWVRRKDNLDGTEGSEEQKYLQDLPFPRWRSELELQVILLLL
jgi:hypothetical protein